MTTNAFDRLIVLVHLGKLHLMDTIAYENRPPVVKYFFPHDRISNDHCVKLHEVRIKSNWMPKKWTPHAWN